jgi:hypothetical protein
MAGPWEQYQQAPAAATGGPWEQYDRRKKPQEPAPEEPTESGLSQFGGGIAHAGKEAYRGLKGLVGGDTAELEKEAREYAAKPKGWQAGAGELVGNVGMLAPLALVPGGIGLQAALAAGTSAAITPGGAGERLTAGALGAGGAALGGAIPGALKLARGAVRGAGEVGERAVAALPGAMGERAAERVGGRQTAKYLERELPGGVGPDVYTPDPRLAAQGARPSAAVATQDPRLAGLQRRSEAMVPEAWAPHEAQQARAQFGALEGGLQKQTDLDALLQQANDIGKKVEGVYEKTGPANFDNEMDKFYDLLQTAKQTAEYHGKPTVQGAVDYIENTMRKAGTVTPSLLHKMRQTVAGGLKGVPGIGDEGVRATASEPFVLSIAQAMDRVIDKASKGRFNQWKGEYAGAMGKAEGAKADINIMSRFVDPATGLPRKAVAGLDDVPVVTPQALKQAIAASGSMKRGPRKGQNVLRPESQQAMEAVLRDVEAGQIVSKIPRAAAPQMGASTVSELAQAAVTDFLLPTGFGTARFVASQGGRKGKEAMERQLAQLLQDPAQLRRFLRAQEQRRMLRAQPAGQLPGGGVVGAAAPLMLGGPPE